ncbi:hypothetical protein EVA_17003, partial [gut metagenome]
MGQVQILTNTAFYNSDSKVAARVEPLEETIDRMCESLREQHIARLKRGECNVESGIVYLDLL